MFPSVCIFLLLSQSPDAPLRSQMAITVSTSAIELSWNDAEDRIQGSITPKHPTEGTALDVSAHVGSFQGAEFDGPVTFSFKPSNSMGGGKSSTVKRAPGERGWRASFLPEQTGVHTLEISFATTRMKVANAKIEVGEAKLPRWPWWILVGLTAAAALGLGVRSVLKKQEHT